MIVERWRQIESIFHAAHEKTAQERSRFLDEACGSDETLRCEVESLLACESSSAGFMESEVSSAGAPGGREPVPAGERIGPYTVLAFLGAGGMGEVYKAHDQRLERDVAVKFLPRVEAGNPAALERFSREARAASALNHPNICTIYDVGEFQGRSFIVMELLEGLSLRDRIGGKPLAAAEFGSFSRQICAGLRAAHAKGIVHRDIKPANIFVTQDGQVKILDFGLAKRGAESVSGTTSAGLSGATRTMSLTVKGAIVGTLAYMSPEQAVGQEVDARSDVFSLGVVLYEMATGRAPFGGKTAAGILGSILTDSPDRPSGSNAAFPQALDDVILKALEKDRERRYQSVGGLAEDLEERGQPAPLKTRRWVLAAAGTGVAALAGGGFLARRSLFPAGEKIRMAVLPFENIGGNPQENFFADGLHQDMISVINRLYPDRIAVIARTSVKRYQATGASVDQVGRDLNVDYVIEGGVQRDRGQAHVTLRLIRVKDQSSLWNATYDRDLGQVVAVQSEIARAVAQGVGGRLQPDARVSAALARPLNAAAHEAYLRGDFSKAVQLDPGYAAAYTGLANDQYYPGLFGVQAPRQAFPRMVEAATKGLDLDPTQAGAHASVALGKLHLEWNWAAAEEGFQRARRLNPSDVEVRHFYGHYLLWAGQSEESAKECRRGLEVDPYNPNSIACLGWHELCAGHEEKALEVTRQALALDPKHGWALFTLGLIYEQRGKFQESLAALRGAWDLPVKASSLGHAFARSGNRHMAEKVLNDLLAQVEKKYTSAYDIAVIYSGLDDNARALEWLSRAYDDHAGFLMFVTSDPRLRQLRRDPRFQELVRRMRFPKVAA